MSSTKFCPNCGAQIHSNSEFCSFCGAKQPDYRPDLHTPPSKYQRTRSGIENEHVSSLWYLAPLLLAVIGGIVAWYVNKDKDPGKARNFLILGVILTLIPVLISLWWLVSIGVFYLGYPVIPCV
jgi:hypothetical protein